jgi:hypothetical protein
MGKYDKILGSLTRVDDTEPDRQAVLNAVKSKIRAAEGFDPASYWLATEYAAIRREKDALADKLSEVQVRLDAISQMIIAQFEVEGISNLKLAPILLEGVPILRPSITVDLQPTASVVDKAAFRWWCLAPAIRSLMEIPAGEVTEDRIKQCLSEGLAPSMTLPSPTAISLTKQRLLEGEPEPDGIVANSYAKIVFRKG